MIPLSFFFLWNCPKTMQKATLENAKNPLYERVFRQIVAEREGFEPSERY